MTKPVVVAALYEFKPFENFKSYKNSLEALCKPLDIRGTLLLAAEGINGTVAGSRLAIDKLKHYLSHIGFNHLNYKESFCDSIPFIRLKVRLKKEIVTMGLSHIQPTQKTGTYVEPKEWNQLINDPDVILIDTRNQYEVQMGTFKGAYDPNINHFVDFPHYVRENLGHLKHKKMALFCTGGIRCEKASSFMLHEGFQEVYHLKGGILKYIETEKDNSLWEGECFVFDKRVSVDKSLNQGTYDMCYGCRHPINKTHKALPSYEEGVTCAYCIDTKTDKSKLKARLRQQQPSC